MPKFRVYKGHDAYVHFMGIVEADDIAAAADFVADQPEAIDWKRTEDVFVYDKSTLFTEMTEPILEGEPDVFEPVTSLTVSEAEHATILAALRYYQMEGQGEPSHRSDMIHDIATNGDTVISLNAEGIDELCVRINQ